MEDHSRPTLVFVFVFVFVYTLLKHAWRTTEEMRKAARNNDDRAAPAAKHTGSGGR
jgi:hypothetical protein